MNLDECMEIPKLPDSLRSEEEIIATWKGNISKPLVSLRCITYNHAPYIEDAIKGFLIQETEFPIEVLIHDDASTDGTREIIENYQKKYPKIIKTILQNVNQYSQGVKPGSFMDPLCSGEYYAVCEGDDYWHYENKLNLQVMMLESHDNLDLCIHSAFMHDYYTGRDSVIGQYGKTNGLIDLVDIVSKTHGQVPTASTLIRASAHKELKEFTKKHPELVVGDIYLHFFGAKRGGAYYIDSPMSVYRLNTEGSFGDRYKKSSELRFKHVSSRVASYLALEEVDRVDSHVSKALRASSVNILYSFLKNPGNTYVNRMKILNSYGFLLTAKKKMVLYPVTYIPLLLNIFHPVVKSLKKFSRSFYSSL